MSKKTTDYEYKDASSQDDIAAVPPPHVLTLMDGTRPVWVRKSAVEAFHGLGDPVTSIRVLLRSGQSLIVAWTDDAKEALLDALVE